MTDLLAPAIDAGAMCLRFLRVAFCRPPRVLSPNCGRLGEPGLKSYLAGRQRRNWPPDYDEVQDSSLANGRDF